MAMSDAGGGLLEFGLLVAAVVIVIIFTLYMLLSDEGFPIEAIFLAVILLIAMTPCLIAYGSSLCRDLRPASSEAGVVTAIGQDVGWRGDRWIEVEVGDGERLKVEVDPDALCGVGVGDEVEVEVLSDGEVTGIAVRGPEEDAGGGEGDEG